MRKTILSIIILILLTSCATLERQGLEKPPLSPEEEAALKRVGEWEGYMNLIGEGDVSLSTVLRLTDEYFQAKDVLFKGEMDGYERRLSEYAAGRLKEEPKRPSQDHKKLIAHFSALSEKYRYDDWADAVRYALGIALYEQGEMNEAVKVFEDILRNYPESDYSTEVSFRLGEFYFETGQYGEALEKYRRILDKPRSAFYEKALYKMGWIHIKLDAFEQAVDMFMAVVDRRWDGKPTEGGQTEEPISCIVLSLDNFKNTGKAIAYLESKGVRGYAPFVLSRLGERLTEETRFAEAALVYRYFTDRFPDDPLCPFVYEKLAALIDRGGAEEESLKTRWAIAHMYNPLTAWYKKNYPNGSEKLDGLLSTTLVSVSRKHHSLGKSGADPSGLDRAVEGYRLYLASYPNGPDAKEMNLLLADALFDSKRYADAAVEYEQAAKLYRQGPEFQDMVYDAFLSYEMVFQNEKTAETARAADRLLEVYRDAVLKNPKLAGAQMRLSSMYAETGDYKTARAVLAPLMDGKGYAEAARMTAELHIKERDFKSAEDVYSSMAGRTKAPESIERLAQVRYMLAEASLKDGKLKEAAAGFDSAFSTRPGSPTGEASLIKLGYINMRLRDYGGLDSTIDLLSKTYPASALANSFTVEAGRWIEVVNPLAAAAYFEKASVNTASTDARTLVNAAAALYEKNGEYGRAEDALKRYLSSGRHNGGDEPSIRLMIAGAQMKAGRKEAVAALAGLVSQRGRIDDGVVARANLMLINSRAGEYLDLRLTQPFEETFDKKTRYLDNFLKEYSEAAKFKIPEILPEIYLRMGALFENFRDSIVRSERPGGLTKEQMDEYGFLLEEKAYPYDEQAVKVYERCADAARRHSLRDEWSERCFARLADIRPALYKRHMDEDWMAPVTIKPEPVTLDAR